MGSLAGEIKSIIEITQTNYGSVTEEQVRMLKQSGVVVIGYGKEAVPQGPVILKPGDIVPVMGDTVLAHRPSKAIPPMVAGAQKAANPAVLVLWTNDVPALNKTAAFDAQLRQTRVSLPMQIYTTFSPHLYVLPDGTLLILAGYEPEERRLVAEAIHHWSLSGSGASADGIFSVTFREHDPSIVRKYSRKGTLLDTKTVAQLNSTLFPVFSGTKYFGLYSENPLQIHLGWYHVYGGIPSGQANTASPGDCTGGSQDESYTYQTGVLKAHDSNLATTTFSTIPSLDEFKWAHWTSTTVVVCIKDADGNVIETITDVDFIHIYDELQGLVADGKDTGYVLSKLTHAGHLRTSSKSAAQTYANTETVETAVSLNVGSSVLYASVGEYAHADSRAVAGIGATFSETWDGNVWRMLTPVAFAQNGAGDRWIAVLYEFSVQATGNISVTDSGPAIVGGGGQPWYSFPSIPPTGSRVSSNDITMTGKWFLLNGNGEQKILAEWTGAYTRAVSNATRLVAAGGLLVGRFPYSVLFEKKNPPSYSNTSCGGKVLWTPYLSLSPDGMDFCLSYSIVDAHTDPRVTEQVLSAETGLRPQFGYLYLFESHSQDMWEYDFGSWLADRGYGNPYEYWYLPTGAPLGKVWVPEWRPDVHAWKPQGQNTAHVYAYANLQIKELTLPKNIEQGTLAHGWIGSL